MIKFPQSKNHIKRSRRYLTSAEIEKTMVSARKVGRHGQRDATMILMAYRHGLRVSELISLKWSQVDLDKGLLQVSRLNSGIDGVHPLFGSELRALRKIKRNYPETQYVFVSERKSPMTSSTFRKLFVRAGKIAGIEFLLNPHMLRHSTGITLASSGKQDKRSIKQYLGHKNIRHSARYAEASPAKFTNFWVD